MRKVTQAPGWQAAPRLPSAHAPSPRATAPGPGALPVDYLQHDCHEGAPPAMLSRGRINEVK